MSAATGRAGAPRPGLVTIAREWGRIGCIGFGGPPAHIALLRRLCVERRKWLDGHEFEDAIAACNLLPGPASTQLAIFCAWRLRGRIGALVGGACFIVPGLLVILALAALFLEGTPPDWVRGAGSGAGAAVAAVAVRAGWSLVPDSRRRSPSRLRWTGYLAAGAVSAATIGPWLVLVLLGCGVLEVALRAVSRHSGGARAILPLPLLAGTGGVPALAWTAIKVGALSYGGGFVIVPLMQADAVSHHHWMTGAQFLNAVALGQVTPGPVDPDRRGRRLRRRRARRRTARRVHRLLAVVRLHPAGRLPFRPAALRCQRPQLPERRRPGRDRRHPRHGRPARRRPRRDLAVRRPRRRRGHAARPAPRRRPHAAPGRCRGGVGRRRRRAAAALTRQMMFSSGRAVRPAKRSDESPLTSTNGASPR